MTNRKNIKNLVKGLFSLGAFEDDLLVFTSPLIHDEIHEAVEELRGDIRAKIREVSVENQGDLMDAIRTVIPKRTDRGRTRFHDHKPKLESE